MALTLYGIPNCDTVKKARAWLAQKELAYSFHDYKKQGVDPVKLSAWVDQTGWEAVLNRRGTTFRALPSADKDDLDAGKAVILMTAHPSCIKRPVVEHVGGLLVGFDPVVWARALNVSV